MDSVYYCVNCMMPMFESWEFCDCIYVSLNFFAFFRLPYLFINPVRWMVGGAGVYHCIFFFHSNALIKGTFTVYTGSFSRFNVLYNLISLFDSMGKIKFLKS